MICQTCISAFGEDQLICEIGFPRPQSDDCLYYEPIRHWYRLVRADEVQYLRLTERIVPVYEQAGYTVKIVETPLEAE